MTEPATRTRYRSAAVIASLVIASALMAIDMIIVSVALPRIGAELPGGSLPALQWLVMGYSLAFGALVQPAGALADRWGSRSMFLTGIAVFTLASLACALAWDVLSLNVFRVAQGAGAAVIFGNVVPLLTRAVDDERRPMAIAVWTATLTGTATVAPLVGGALIALGGWRWMFLVNIPLGVLAFVMAAMTIKSDRPSEVHGRFDVLGAVIVTATLLALNLGLSLAQDRGFADTAAAGALAATVLLAVAFALHHRRVAQPVFDLALLRVRSFSGVVALAVINRIGTVGGAVFYILYLQAGHGLSPLETGLLLVPLGVATAGGSLLGGKAQQWLAAKWVLTAGFGLLTVGGLWIAATAVGGGDPVGAIPALTLWGLGNGLANAPLMTVAAAAVPPTRVGMAAGTVNSSFPLGASLGTVLVGMVVTGAVGPVDTAAGMAPALLGGAVGTAFWLISATMLVGTLVAALLVSATPGVAARPAETAADKDATPV